MRHILFAIFDSSDEAQICQQTLQELPRVTVVLHRDKLNRNDASIEETSARAGIITGALAGALMGGIIGVILSGPLDMVPGDTRIGIFFGIFGGAGAGALGGGLSGAGEPDPVLTEVEEEVKQGKVLLTIEPRSRAEIADIERICRAHGARITRKPFFGFWTNRLRSRWRARMPPRMPH
jgi:uncharacterized membrane protein